MEGSGYENKVLHYMYLLTGHRSEEKGGESNSDVDAPSNDLHQRYLDYKRRKHRGAALQPRSLRKATKIVNVAIEYGLANGIITKKGPGLYLNHGEPNPTQSVEEDIQIPSSSRVEPEQLNAPNVDGEPTNVDVAPELPWIKKERLSNDNLPQLKRLQDNAGVERRTTKKRKMRRHRS